MRVSTAGSTKGDQRTFCVNADKSGLAGKSQPPELLCFRWKRFALGTRVSER